MSRVDVGSFGIIGSELDVSWIQADPITTDGERELGGY